jgi:3-hydroxybutyryl-CoA dehydratase
LVVPAPLHRFRAAWHRVNGSGVRYDDARVGATFSSTLTVTETHLVLGAGLIGDFNPHHVDDSYAKGSRYGGRILHGMLTGAIMGAPVGMYFHGTAIGFLEHNVRFVAPVRAGDTLTTTWTIAAKHDKPKHAGGIVDLDGECRNQDGIVVAVAQSKMLAGNSHTTPGIRTGDE